MGGQTPSPEIKPSSPTEASRGFLRRWTKDIGDNAYKFSSNRVVLVALNSAIAGVFLGWGVEDIVKGDYYNAIRNGAVVGLTGTIAMYEGKRIHKELSVIPNDAKQSIPNHE